ncbi:hypothetical protein [Rhizobium sp. rho-1.1]
MSKAIRTLENHLGVALFKSKHAERHLDGSRAKIFRQNETTAQGDRSY